MSVDGCPPPRCVDREPAVVADKNFISGVLSDPLRLESDPSLAADIDKSWGTAGASDDGHLRGEVPTASAVPGALPDSPLILNSGDPVAYDARREFRIDRSGTPWAGVEVMFWTDGIGAAASDDSRAACEVTPSCGRGWKGWVGFHSSGRIPAVPGRQDDNALTYCPSDIPAKGPAGAGGTAARGADDPTPRAASAASRRNRILSSLSPGFISPAVDAGSRRLAAERERRHRTPSERLSML